MNFPPFQSAQPCNKWAHCKKHNKAEFSCKIDNPILCALMGTLISSARLCLMIKLHWLRYRNCSLNISCDSHELQHSSWAKSIIIVFVSKRRAAFQQPRLCISLLWGAFNAFFSSSNQLVCTHHYRSLSIAGPFRIYAFNSWIFFEPTFSLGIIIFIDFFFSLLPPPISNPLFLETKWCHVCVMHTPGNIFLCVYLPIAANRD